MQFVQVQHPNLGTTFVPETRIPHLSDGWSVVEDGKPKPKGDPLRVTAKADTAPTNPEAGGAGNVPQED